MYSTYMYTVGWLGDAHNTQNIFSLQKEPSTDGKRGHYAKLSPQLKDPVGCLALCDMAVRLFTNSSMPNVFIHNMVSMHHRLNRNFDCHAYDWVWLQRQCEWLRDSATAKIFSPNVSYSLSMKILGLENYPLHSSSFQLTKHSRDTNMYVHCTSHC